MKLVQNRRTISWRPVKRLDKQTDANTESAASGATDHTHTNKDLLDSLSMDSHGRLKASGQVINIPLMQEDW